MAAPVVAQTRLSVGHSYSSAGALRQPATVVALKAQGGPWLSKLDGGVVWRVPSRRLTLELGARASAGSARTRAERVYGAIIRSDWSVPSTGIGVTALAEYEADGGFYVEKGFVGVEVTPLGWPAGGLGRFTGRGARGLRWRPWLGVGVVTEGNLRALARLEAALRVPVGDWMMEGDVEGTTWYIDGINGTSYGQAALSLELGRSGLTLTFSAEEGRRPPVFAKSSYASLGLGLRLPVVR